MESYYGIVKSFNPDKGWGHIECDQTHALYGKDVFLLRSNLTGGAQVVNKGAKVSFKTNDNGRGPEAVEVEILAGGEEAAEVAVESWSTPSYSPRGGAKFGGGGGGGGANAAAAGGSSFLGVIKSFNPSSGWGHITCAETERIYGKDIFFMKSQIPGGNIQKNTTVQFSVMQGAKGPEGTSIRPMYGLVSSGTMPMQQAQQWGGGGGGAQQWGGGASGQVYYGSLKSYNEEKGWGHISCPQTQQMYGKDMFVLRSALKGASAIVGSNVSFSVVMGNKGPEASNVKVIGAVTPDATYFGTIKQFNEEKGWGFIACDDTRTLYAKDIFIHRNELNGYVPSVGEAVQFSVQMSDQGRPEGTQLSFGPGRYVAPRKPSWGKGRSTPY